LSSKPPVWPEGVGRQILATVDSTNDEAARLAASGRRNPCWILALEQTRGRGRRGRAWIAPPGNFSATLLMFPTEPPAQVALRSFVAALALHDALVAVTGRSAGLGLKWPNDVLLNGGKLAGILLESGSAAGGVSHLSVGIAVNLLAAPAQDQLEPGAVPPVSLLSQTGVRVRPEAFLEALAPRFARYEQQFVTCGFAPIRSAWLARAARLGETITARCGQESLSGRFETLDERGALVLHTAQGRRRISAGEVFFQ